MVVGLEPTSKNISLMEFVVINFWVRKSSEKCNVHKNYLREHRQCQQAIFQVVVESAGHSHRSVHLATRGRLITTNPEEVVLETLVIVEIHMAGKNARGFLYSWGSATRQHHF